MTLLNISGDDMPDREAVPVEPDYEAAGRLYVEHVHAEDWDDLHQYERAAIERTVRAIVDAALREVTE